MMGQAVRKMRRGKTKSSAPADSGGVATAVATDATQKSPGITPKNEIVVQLQDSQDKSTSSQWITEVPTRSSSLFSDPTGFSSFVTTEESKLTSLKTSDGVEGGTTQSQPRLRKSASNHSSSNVVSSSGSNTSNDHPPLPRLNLTEDELGRQAVADREWQDAVNMFLQNDPIAKTPKPRTQAKYLIRRNYCSIKRDVGWRWKKAVEKFQARLIFPSIPIPNSEWSEA